ncbi:MAG: NUDIX domain-containing protein [bacterium]|nr:NUDIX domain-containing protein [bacterium]
MRFNYQVTDATKNFSAYCMGILEVQGKILLVQDKSKKYYGRWMLPSKKSSTTDRLVLVAEQGLKESTDIKANVDKVVGVYHTYNVEDKRGTLIFTFAMNKARGELNVATGNVLSASWFTYKEIFKMPEESFRYSFVRTMIKDYRKGKRYPVDLIHTV